MSALSRFLNLFRPRSLRRDLDDEVRFHLEMRVESNLRRGMNRMEAETDAHRRFGNVTRITEDMREVRVARWVESLWQDLRYGMRSLRRERLSTVAVLVMLGLGIGANAAIFTLLNALWLRPLPYEHPERLVTLVDSFARLGPNEASPTVPEFLDVRASSSAFERMAFLDHRDAQVTGGPEPVRVFGARVTASFFPLLGVNAALGRVFRDEDNQPGHDTVVILTDRIWRRAFAADPAIVGRPLMINDSQYTVIGVLPSGFAFDYPGLDVPEPVEIYTPFLMNEYYTLRSGGHSNVRRVRTLARLKEGYDVPRARAEIKIIAQRLAVDHPDLYRGRPSGEDLGFTMDVRPLQEAVVAGSRTIFALLFSAVGAVLLIACANTAQFLLARSFQRRQEVAVRTALGASRGRLIRQFLSESLLIAAVSGFLGFWGSQVIVRALVAIVPERSLLLIEVGPDARVLAFIFGLSCLTAVLFGLLPALLASSSGAGRTLATTRAARSEPRHLLVAFEVALSVVLLVCAGTLTRGLLEVHNTPRGFTADHVTVMQIRMQGFRQNASQPNPSMLYQQYVERIRQIPGVESAAVFSGQPVMLMGARYLVKGGGTDVATLSRQTARYDIVGPGFFQTLGIPLKDGRSFTESDTQGRPIVAIVNEELARRVWPSESAVGRHLQVGRDLTVIGVVGNVRMFGSGMTVEPQIYVPSLQNYEPNAAIAVRMAGGANPPIQAIKEAIWSLAPEQAVFNIRSMDEIVARTVAAPRFNTLLIGGFAALAVILSAAGVYGLVSYLVTRRTREIAIRVAIGARRGHVFWLVSRDTLGWALVGLIVGVGGALAGHRALKSALDGVGQMDLATLAAVTVLYLSVSAVAVLVPARRALHLDAMRALKCD